MAWGIFISCMTLFGTLALVMVDLATAPDPPASFGEVEDSRRDIEGQDIRNAA